MTRKNGSDTCLQHHRIGWASITVPLRVVCVHVRLRAHLQSASGGPHVAGRRPSWSVPLVCDLDVVHDPHSVAGPLGPRTIGAPSPMAVRPEPSPAWDGDVEVLPGPVRNSSIAGWSVCPPVRLDSNPTTPASPVPYRGDLAISIDRLRVSSCSVIILRPLWNLVRLCPAGNLPHRATTCSCEASGHLQARGRSAPSAYTTPVGGHFLGTLGLHPCQRLSRFLQSTLDLVLDASSSTQVGPRVRAAAQPGRRPLPRPGRQPVVPDVRGRARSTTVECAETTIQVGRAVSPWDRP